MGIIYSSIENAEKQINLVVDDDWNYVVELLPNGKAKIKIFDEDGEFVDYF